MFKKTAILAMAFVAAIFAAQMTPARAITLPPPGGDSLFVTAYYSSASKTELVGQKWHGCGQPSGSWGATTPWFTVFFPAC
jgi:hypothetical protein